MTLPWFARLKYDGVVLDGRPTPDSQLTGVLVQNIEGQLSDMQYVGKKFAKRIENFQSLIDSDEADGFEGGITELGVMLGYKAWKPQAQAEPDSVWCLESQVFFLFEAKSDESATDPISVRTCREAAGHAKWLKQQPMIPGNAEIITLVISPRTVLAKEAIPHAEGLYFMTVGELRTLATSVVSALRSVRSKASDMDVEDRLRIIADSVNGSGLTHEAVRERLTKRHLTDLKTR
jgi:hypothetical protein